MNQEKTHNPILQPQEIESESFRIITEELKQYNTSYIQEEQLPIVKRVIHTTADFSYVDNLCFSENAVEIGINLLTRGATIVTDTTMVKSGINKTVASSFGCSVHCFVADEDVATEAKQRGITRSMVSVEKSSQFSPLIYVVGNAPTALFTLHDLYSKGDIRPDFVIGVPVGFVNVVESKELILSSPIPHIVAKGRKGGSNVAASIVNALLYQAMKKEN